jgi:RHS repeat-associated protein
LDDVELIHMNGRVYDYNVGRFMSVDPFVHAGSQGLNPYSYIMNNPLAGTDPSGYSPEKETVEITSETEFFEDGDGNQFVSAGDGSGDLISVDSVTRSGSVSSGGITTSYSVTTNSNGSFSGSISSTQGSSVTNTVFAGDIGSQSSLSKDDPVSSVGNTTGCETVSCNSSLYGELDSYIQKNVSNGGADSSWFAAASEVTSLQGIGAIDATNLGFITDPEENYFRFVTHSLVSHNYQAFSEIRKGGFGGLSGKRLDDLLVVREQLLVEMLTDRHFGNNSQARANVLSGLSASMNHNNPARRLMSIPGRTGRALERELGGGSFNIGNLQHRIKVGISMVDEIRAERGN